MISRNPSFCETELPNKLIIETTCPFCGKERRLVLESGRIDAYKKGKLAYESGVNLQRAFPSFTLSERELILTGICDDCLDSM